MKSISCALGGLLMGSMALGAVAVATGLSASSVALAREPAVEGASVKAGYDAWMQGDYPKAIAIWRPLAQAGDPDAQFNLGQAYKIGRGVAVDYPVAMEWYRKAAAQGHLRAEDNYGHLLFQLNRRADAIPYLRRSADRGDPLSAYFLGTALYNGDSVARDPVTAYALMTRAASAGIPAATTSLATMDQYIPTEDRKKGLALAARMEQQQQQAALATPRPTMPPTQSSPPPQSYQPTPLPQTPPPSAASGLPPGAIPPPVYHPTPPPVPKPPVRPATPRPVPAPQATYTPPPAPPSYQAPASPPPVAAPAPAPAPVASAPRPAQGAWRVQLGVFSEEGRARTLWSGLISRVSGLSSYQPYLVRQGNLTRLQAGPLASAAQAQKLCNAIKAAGSDCLIKGN